MKTFNELLRLRALATKLDRQFDAADRDGNFDAMLRISSEQLRCDEEIEVLEARLDHAKFRVPSRPNQEQRA